MAAVMSSDMDNTEKTVIFYEDALKQRIKVINPDVNHSFYKFVCNNNLEILYGLGAIKGLGYSAIESIVAEREKNGRFQDLFDFCNRVDLKKINKRALEALCKSGALDSLGPARAVIYNNIENAVNYADQDNKNKSSGQTDLFGLFNDADTDTNNSTNSKWVKLDSKEWPNMVKLQGERDTLGIFASGHPIDDYTKELQALSVTKIKNLRVPAGNNFKNSFNAPSSVIAGVIIGIRRVKTKSGSFLSIVTLDDKSARLDVVLFDQEAERFAEFIVKDKVVVAVGRVSEDKFTGGVRMQVNQLMDLQEAKISKTNTLKLILTDKLIKTTDCLLNLSEILSEYTPGNCNIVIEYHTDDGRGVLVPDKKWHVTLTQNLLQKLYGIIPEENVKLLYHY